MVQLSEFTEIPGFAQYLISKKGEIYSKLSNRLLIQNLDRFKKDNTYIRVSLKIGEKLPKLLVHRLVALAYLPNPKNKPNVNHKDGNKYNNHVDNLEWTSHKEQSIHVHANGLRKKDTFSSAVVRVKKDGEVIHYDSVMDASRKEKIQHCSISIWLRNGKVNKAGDRWWYKVQYEMGEEALKNEIWKNIPIKGEKSNYYISNLGNFKFNNVIRRGHIKSGYRKYGLSIDGKFVHFFAHNLVANAFLDHPTSEDLTVDHIDRNKLNNRVENLRWATKSEQSYNRGCCIKIPIVNITKTGENFVCIIHDSMKEAAEFEEASLDVITDRLKNFRVGDDFWLLKSEWDSIK